MLPPCKASYAAGVVAAPASASRTCGSFLVKLLETGERRAAKLTEKLSGRCKAARAHRIHVARARGVRFDETRPRQHAEVSGDGRSTHRELRGQLSDGTGTDPQFPEDRAANGASQSVKGVHGYSNIQVTTRLTRRTGFGQGRLDSVIELVDDQSTRLKRLEDLNRRS
jgi:hypothetical protein